ncbi:MAG: VanZ family protein [Evtepia sp.]
MKTYTKHSNKILLPILIAITLCFIWGNSLMPSSISGAFSHRINDLIHTFFQSMGETSTQSDDGLLRKIAHASEFAVLGIELTLLFFHQLPKKCASLLLSGLSVAFIDETIQLFVTGRAGMIRDVWIDLSGFFIGCLLTFLLRTIYHRHHTHWVY